MVSPSMRQLPARTMCSTGAIPFFAIRESILNRIVPQGNARASQAVHIAQLECFRQPCLLEHFISGVTSLDRTRHSEMLALDRAEPDLVATFARAYGRAAVFPQNGGEVPIKVGHQALARSRCSSALKVRDSLSLGCPDSSRSSGSTSLASSIIAVQVSASTTSPGTSS